LETARVSVGECNAALSSCQDQLPVDKTFQTYTDVSADCVDLPGDWYFNTATGSLSQNFCVHNGQFVVVDDDGKTYPTCVQYDSQQTTPCDMDNFICGAQRDGIQGWPNQSKDALTEAVKRADFKHKDCPTVQDECSPLGTYWTDFITDASVFTAEETNNVCVSAAGQFRVVQKDQYADTCVGFNENARTPCPNDRDYICAGNDGGSLVYGWPGQIVATLGKALANVAENYRHPQCSGL